MESGFRGLSPKDLRDASEVFGQTNRVVAEAMATLSTVARADWAVLGERGSRYRESLGPVVRRSDQAARDIGTLTQKLLANIAEQVEASQGHAAETRSGPLTRELPRLAQAQAPGPDRSGHTPDENWLSDIRGRRSPAGEISGGLADPNPSGRKIDPVKAHIFPGQSDRRVLIIGGVHGSEPEGAEVVRRLVRRLSAESGTNAPEPTVILIPELIEKTARPYGAVNDLSARYVPDSPDVRASGRGVVEPNRNFPLPGMTYAEALTRGLLTLPTDKDGKPIPGADPRPPQDFGVHNNSSVKMLPETRVLMSVLEKFDPHVIVSLHAHSIPGKSGAGPGVFVDPRGIDPRTGEVIDSDARNDDNNVTMELLSETEAGLEQSLLADAFRGNNPERLSAERRVSYRSTAHADGNSLGMYGPVPTAERPGATTITIEMPEFMRRKNLSLEQNQADLNKVVDATVNALNKVVLGRPR